MKVKDIVEFLSDRFNGHMLNLIYFAIGLGIGMILFLLVFLIVFLLFRQHVVIQKIISNKHVVIKEEYKEIIKTNSIKYHNEFEEAPIKDKLVGLGNILFDMLSSIAALYYPESKEPIFEISTARIVDILGYAAKRIDYIVDHLLEERLAIIDRITKYSIKDKKISLVMELINKKPAEIQDVPEKKGLLSSVKKKISKIGGKVAARYGANIMNKEFKDIIIDLGEDINKMYSGQELIFNDVSLRVQARNRFLDRIARRELKHKESIGDKNA